jgi:6-phospho-beta-glucosidase
MKIAVIGGAGVRTPLLVKGLTRSDLPIDEIALFDLNPDRLDAIASLARSYARSVRTFPTASLCVADADFVFLSIRAGGIDARARDEASAIALGVAGQETIGPAGFAMAMRNVPPAVEYARLVAGLAPRAWIINFTNPVGIVTQAMTQDGHARVIGICDTPTELFATVVRLLHLPHDRCFFDYFGLNHLGWLREVYVDGEPQLSRLWDNDPLLERVYRPQLFDVLFLRQLRLLPTEYLFFYYRPRDALANLRAAGRTRGRDIAELNERLFRDLATAGSSARQVYETYLEQRSAGYLRLEAGAARVSDTSDTSTSQIPATSDPFGSKAVRVSDTSDTSGLAGYDKIALAVVRAIHFNTNTVIPLNVSNRGTLRGLADADIVEVPCVVGANGAHPLAVAPMPDDVRELVVRVKEYERFTVDAASAPSMDAVVRALSLNPLVGTHALARRLVDSMQPLW